MGGGRREGSRARARGERGGNGTRAHLAVVVADDMRRRAQHVRDLRVEATQRLVRASVKRRRTPAECVARTCSVCASRLDVSTFSIEREA